MGAVGWTCHLEQRGRGGVTQEDLVRDGILCNFIDALYVATLWLYKTKNNTVTCHMTIKLLIQSVITLLITVTDHY